MINCINRGSDPMGDATEPKPPRGKDDGSQQLFRYLRAFIVPTIFLKAAIFYFGINYSNDPGVGYGWGLAISIALSLVNFGIFIYLNWQDSDEGE